MGRNNRTTVKTRRRAQRPKTDHEQVMLTLYATERLLCGCWSSSPAHTCGMAPPRYCTCGATTNEGCACPSPIGRAS